MDSAELMGVSIVSEVRLLTGGRRLSSGKRPVTRTRPRTEARFPLKILRRSGGDVVLPKAEYANRRRAGKVGRSSGRGVVGLEAKIGCKP